MSGYHHEACGCDSTRMVPFVDARCRPEPAHDIRDAEIKALRSRVAGLEALLGWAIGWVAEEIEPCKRRHEGCPWDKDHDQLDASRALLGAEEKMAKTRWMVDAAKKLPDPD